MNFSSHWDDATNPVEEPTFMPYDAAPTHSYSDLIMPTHHYAPEPPSLPAAAATFSVSPQGMSFLTNLPYQLSINNGLIHKKTNVIDCYKDRFADIPAVIDAYNSGVSYGAGARAVGSPPTFS
jgi:hypothetical protein